MSAAQPISSEKKSKIHEDVSRKQETDQKAELTEAESAVLESGDLNNVCAVIQNKYPEVNTDMYLRRYIRSRCKYEDADTVFTNVPKNMLVWIKRCRFKYHVCRTLKTYDWVSACISLAGEIESDRSALSVGRRRKTIGKDALLQLKSVLGGEVHAISASVGTETIVGHVLHIKGFLNNQQQRDTTFELQHIHPDFIDNKMWSHGTCKTKLARTNSNIGFIMQRGTIEAPDPSERKSSIVPYSCMPAAAAIKNRINAACGDFDMKDLNTELNFYNKDGGIGNHMDSERSFVIGLSLGNTRKFQLTPFKGAMPVGETTDFVLESGDAYVMDTIAKGHAKSYSRLHFRHCAGGGSGEFLRKMWMGKACQWRKKNNLNPFAQKWVEWADAHKSRKRKR